MWLSGSLGGGFYGKMRFMVYRENDADVHVDEGTSRDDGMAVHERREDLCWIRGDVRCVCGGWASS